MQAYLIGPVTDGGEAVQAKLPASCRCVPSAAQRLSGTSLPPRWALMEWQPWPQRGLLERRQGEHGQLGPTKDYQAQSVLAALFLWPSPGPGCFLIPKMLTQSQVQCAPFPSPPTPCRRCSSGGDRCSRGPGHPQTGQSAHERQGGLCAWP